MQVAPVAAPVVNLPPSRKESRNREHLASEPSRRSAPRSRRVSAADAQLTLTFGDPRTPPLTVQATVRELSYRDLSFHSKVPVAAWKIGAVLSGVQIRKSGRLAVTVDLEIRSALASLGGGSVCGARVVPGSHRASSLWTKLALSQVNPQTDVGSRFDREVWELYAESGYFNLSGKSVEDFVDTRGALAYSSDCLERDPGLGYRVVWSKDEKVHASVSIVRPYARTWLGHQMAKSKKNPLDRADSMFALRSLYERAFEPRDDAGDADWLLGYCEAHVRWMRAAHFDFATRHQDSGKACVVPFQLLEARCDGTWHKDDETEVRVADERDVARLLQVISATRPLAYREALDLVPERFDLGDVKRDWQAAGLERDRRVLIARRGGVDVAAAVVEVAERGINMFNILDSVRLFALGPAAADVRQQAFRALLGTSAGIYGAEGRETFVYYCEEKNRAHADGLRDLGEGYTWIVAGELTQAFLDHVRALTEQRPSERLAEEAPRMATGTHG